MPQCSRFRRAARVPRLAGLLLLLAVACSTISPARADDAISQANALYADIAPGVRSDLVLLPLLAKAAAPPLNVASPERAALYPATGKDWAAVEAWVQAPPQAALLQALVRVTREKDWNKAFAFGQPYGAEGVSPELIRAGLYTELGDPPTLAAGQHLYLPRLSTLECAANVEATRLAAAGKCSDAIDVMTNFVWFARQMTDRALAKESQWGWRAMSRGLHRIRDLAFGDMGADRKLDLGRLRGQIDRLAGTGAYLDPDRAKLPRAQRIATDQVINRVYANREGVNPTTFPATMARLATAGKPLRLFSEAAKWKSAAGAQAGGVEAAEKVSAVYADWASRWTTEWFDRRNAAPSTYSTLDPKRFATIVVSTPDLLQLADDRQIVRTEIVGTRAALALVGFAYTTHGLAQQLSVVRPRWLSALEADPYNPERASGAQPPLEYFVPMRDTPRGATQEPEPYEINLVGTTADAGNVTFSVRLRDDVFVLYSRGTDNARNMARRVQNTSELVQGADYLLWPPVLSLYRQHVIDQGDLE